MTDYSDKLVTKYIPIDANSTNDLGHLFLHLSYRTATEAISHRQMPTFDEHSIYVRRSTHPIWNFIEHDGRIIGNFYVSVAYEIGIFIHETYRQLGLATDVINWCKQAFPQQDLFANINPANEKSIELFKSAGFEFVQVTYRFTKPVASLLR